MYFIDNSVLTRLFGAIVTAGLFMIIGVGAFFPHALSAQERSGIGISPAIIQENIEPGETKRFTISVTNSDNEAQTYYARTRTITGTQDGTPLYADRSATPGPNELAGWITLERTEFELEPGVTTRFEAEITAPESASPGSQFASIIISSVPPNLERTGAAVAYDVSNVIIMRVAGEVIEQANIRQFSTDNFFYGSSDVEFTVRVENEGNVFVQPAGPLEIYNMFGQPVAQQIFNDKREGIFPYETRSFKARWRDDGIGFGRYEAVVSLVYGSEGNNRTISSTATFWVLPMNIILPAVGVLAVLLLLVYIAVRLYVRNVLRQVRMTGGRRIVKSSRSTSGGNNAVLLTVIVMLAVTAVFLIILLLLFA